VRNLLAVTKFNAMMVNAFGQMTKSLPDMIRKASTNRIESNPALTAEQKKAELAKLEKEIPEAMARMNALFNDPTIATEMADAIVPLYARHFSVDEINQISAFYKSDVGGKMLATMPQLMGESMQISQQIMAPRINKLLAQFTTPAAPK
jgi:uncharacterized protein